MYMIEEGVRRVWRLRSASALPVCDVVNEAIAAYYVPSNTRPREWTPDYIIRDSDPTIVVPPD
jgi:hypothetical protein